MAPKKTNPKKKAPRPETHPHADMACAPDALPRHQASFRFPPSLDNVECRNYGESKFILYSLLLNLANL